MSNDLKSSEALKAYARKVICGDNPTNSLLIRMFDEIIDNAPTVEFFCSYLSDGEVRQPCVEGPCEHERPQGDLISREALLKAMEEERQYLLARGQTGVEHILVHHCLPIIDNAPTVETTKVEHKAYNEGFKDGVDQGIKLSERPHGKWYKNGQSFINPNKFLSYCCSNCHSDLDEHIRIAPNFCPNCGADMKGGAE